MAVNLCAWVATRDTAGRAADEVVIGITDNVAISSRPGGEPNGRAAQKDPNRPIRADASVPATTTP